MAAAAVAAPSEEAAAPGGERPSLIPVLAAAHERVVVPASALGAASSGLAPERATGGLKRSLSLLALRCSHRPTGEPGRVGGGAGRQLGRLAQHLLGFRSHRGERRHRRRRRNTLLGPPEEERREKEVARGRASSMLCLSEWHRVEPEPGLLEASNERQVRLASGSIKARIEESGEQARSCEQGELSSSSRRKGKSEEAQGQRKRTTSSPNTKTNLAEFNKNHQIGSGAKLTSERDGLKEENGDEVRRQRKFASKTFWPLR